MSGPDNMEDVIDSREVIEAIEEIENEIQQRILDALFPDAGTDGEEPSWEEVSDANIDAADAINVLPQSMWPDGLDDVADELHDLAEDLVSLRKLAAQGENIEDWRDGVTLVRDSYFKDYAEQFADDIGAIGRNATHAWPLDHIDWEAAAIDLQQDYTAVDFDGVTYWCR